MEVTMANSVEEKLKPVIDRIKSNTKKASIEIKIKESDYLALTDSKLGGYPYIPTNSKVPVDGEGVILYCLAQINLADLPQNDKYPDKGVLQFWIGRDDVYGMDFDDGSSGKNHAVIYYENLDLHVTESDVAKKYQLRAAGSDNYAPVDVTKSFGLEFKAAEKYISKSHYQFDENLAKAYNAYYPDEKIEDIFDLDEAHGDYIWNVFYGFGHQMGGYASFTQTDIRAYGDYDDYTELLFQLDMDSVFDVMWGDAGVGNFFITKEQLRQRDFSKVLYNWDCS